MFLRMQKRLLLLNDYEVAILPGIAFGNDNYIRISYATSENVIEEAINRLIKFSKDII